MELKLTIYTDETLEEVKRVCEVDELKIPYRVATKVISSLDGIDFNDNNNILNFITKNVTLVDKVLKATFHVTDSELECINTGEMVGIVTELYAWVINKVNNIKGDKNGKK